MLEIHNIDLHYHAGQEREPGDTLEDFLLYARISGRKVLGLTDHLGKYFNRKKTDRPLPYDTGMEGLRQYYCDIESLRPGFPDICILFAPEIGPRDEFNKIPGELLEISDYFICEVLFEGNGINENTEDIIRRMAGLRDFSDDSGKPAFLAHPFRQSINRRVTETRYEFEPWVTSLRPRSGDKFSREEINNFFELDIGALGKASREYGIPFEINGNTNFRVRACNIPAVLRILWQACEEALGEGAEFVPASDLHGIKRGKCRIGDYVPVDCFEMLGLGVGDMPFLGHFPEVVRMLKDYTAFSGAKD